METLLVFVIISVVVWNVVREGKRSDENFWREKHHISRKREKMFTDILVESDPIMQMKKFDVLLKDPHCTREDLISLVYCLSSAKELNACHYKAFEALEDHEIEFEVRKEIFQLYSHLLREKDRNYILDFTWRESSHI